MLVLLLGWLAFHLAALSFFQCVYIKLKYNLNTDVIPFRLILHRMFHAYNAHRMFHNELLNILLVHFCMSWWLELFNSLMFYSLHMSPNIYNGCILILLSRGLSIPMLKSMESRSVCWVVSTGVIVFKWNHSLARKR